MNIHPEGAHLLRADGQTDKHDNVKSHFSQFHQLTGQQTIRTEQSFFRN